MNQQVYCYCPGRFCWQVAAIRRCQDCGRWVCQDYRERHRREEHPAEE